MNKDNTTYERVATLVDQIKYAKYDTIVERTEELIDSGLWRDYTTPAGTHFEFLPKEFDYFLSAFGDVDEAIIRHAYGRNGNDARLWLRLCDITGRGERPAPTERRPAEDVAEQYATDPSGAGKRIKELALVSAGHAAVAADDSRRAAAVAGADLRGTLDGRKCWRVRWRDDRPAAAVIAAKLLEDPDLAHEVYLKLKAAETREARSCATLSEQTRRSGHDSETDSGPQRGSS